MQQLHHASSITSHALLKEISALSKSLPMVLSPMSCGTKLHIHIPQKIVQDTMARFQSFATTPGTNSPFSLSHETQCIIEITRSLSKWHSLDSCLRLNFIKKPWGPFGLPALRQKTRQDLLTFLASQLTVNAISAWNPLCLGGALWLLEARMQTLTSFNVAASQQPEKALPKKTKIRWSSQKHSSDGLKATSYLWNSLLKTPLIIQELPASLWQSSSQ